MSHQVKGSKIESLGHPAAAEHHHVSGSKMQELARNLRRRGIVVHFGVDRDPRKAHNT